MRTASKFANWRGVSVAAVALLAPQTSVAPAWASMPPVPQVSTASVDAGARASALVARMTREEKLQLVHGYFPPMANRTPGAPLADMIPSAGYVPGIPRLGIPPLRESDASLGVANQVEQRRGDVATALPSASPPQPHSIPRSPMPAG